MVFRPIDLYVITSTYLTFFFQNPKKRDFFTVFCCVSYVFSNCSSINSLTEKCRKCIELSGDCIEK